MNEAKPGARLAGRYRLVERTAVSPDESTWRAVDSTLDREVVVWILRPGHPFADDVLDAARRVALIDDRRLSKVLDVGTDSGTQGDRAYVVNEFVEGQSLESLVQPRPLGSVAARRVAGEVAEGLAAAAARGMHHLKLTPRQVTVTTKGLVKITGLAVHAAAAGLDPGHATRANRTDATAAVALLYTGLTGRWPLGDAGFPPAPRTSAGQPVPAGQLEQGVPAELDELCTRTLGTGEGPASPADLALDLTPWSSAAQAELTSTGTGETPVQAGTPATPATPAPVAVAAPAPPAKEPAEAPAAKAPAAKAPATPPVKKAAAKKAVAKKAAPAKTATKKTAAPPAAVQRVAAEGPPAPLPTRPVRTGDDRFRPSPPVMPPPMTAPVARTPGTGRPPLRPGLGPAPNPPAATNGTAPPAAPGTSSGPPTGGLFRPNVPAVPVESRNRRPASPRPDERRPDQSRPNGRPAQRPPQGPRPGNQRPGTQRPDGQRPPAAAVPSTGEQLLPWANTWSGSAEAPSALESTGPFPLVIPQEAPPPKQSRQVILAVVGALVVVLVIAGFSVRGLLKGGDDATVEPGDPAATGPSLTEPTADPTGADGSPSPSASASSAPVPPRIAAIRAIDPQGDGDENTSDSPRAVDGDAGTTWTSQRYNSAKFGGLKKGIGLAIRLERRTVVNKVEVVLQGSGGRVQLRLGPSSDPTAATVADSAAIGSGTVTLEPQRSLRARYVILWFTELPRTSGGYRAEVAEVRVT